MFGADPAHDYTALTRSAVVRIAVPRPLSSFPRTKVNNQIDELVLAKLKELGIPPSEICTDQEFFRRVSLDVIGTLPEPEDVRAFLADEDPRKRSKLIEQLLDCHEDVLARSLQTTGCTRRRSWIRNTTEEIS